MHPPAFPIGPFDPERPISAQRRDQLIEDLALTPPRFAKVVEGLSGEQLDSPYVNWSIRQIVHHVADSHMNCFIRFKWALTEDHPTIKAYDEGAWSQLPDAQAEITLGLSLLESIHAKWDSLLRAMTDTDFARTFQHPESGNTPRLDELLPMYTWHARHHAAQIQWVRDQQGW